MDRHLYVVYGTWLCVLILLAPVMTQSDPAGVMCYVCSSAGQDQDYCSADVFDEFSDKITTEKGCVVCKTVVSWHEGSTLTNRSCVQGDDSCQAGYETKCCTLDFCNGRRVETSGSATKWAGWTLALTGCWIFACL